MMVLTLFLILTLGLGFWRIIHGPTKADRLLPVQLFGSTAIALLLFVSHAQEAPRLLDVALILAALSVVLPAALAEHLRKSGDE